MGITGRLNGTGAESDVTCYDDKITELIADRFHSNTVYCTRAGRRLFPSIGALIATK